MGLSSRNHQGESRITADESENSCIDMTRPVENNVARVPHIGSSPVFFRDCYSERGLVGRCNDICCRGTSLDFVGSSTRPAIPSLDRTAINLTNKQDKPRRQNEAMSYSQEKNYYEVVDMTVDKKEIDIRGVSAGSKIPEALSCDGPVLREGIFDINDSKITMGRSSYQGDPVYSPEESSAFVPVQNNSPGTSLEFITASRIAEDLSRKQPLKRDHDLALTNKQESEERCMREAFAMEQGFNDGSKRKLCTRVPYRQRSNFQAGRDLPKANEDDNRALVKTEPPSEDCKIESDGSVKLTNDVVLTLETQDETQERKSGRY